MGEFTKEFTSGNFDAEVIQSTQPVMVDFWAEWCGPCKMLSPVIDELANEYSAESVSIGKVNVDENADIASEYGVRSIPCLLFFKNGKVEQQRVGVMGKEEISSLIEQLK